MKTDQLVACHDCGSLYHWRPLASCERASCTRCQHELYRWHKGSPARQAEVLAALTLGAVLVFLLAQWFPIVTLEMGGMLSGATLYQAVAVLWGAGDQVIAAMVFFCAIIFPGIELASLFYVALGLTRGVRVPGFNLVLRTVQGARH